MSYVNYGFNGESGYRKVRVNVSRVPCEGERVEFWNPNGAAAGVDPELDGNVFFVDTVTWVTYWRVGEEAAVTQANVFLVRKGEYADEMSKLEHEDLQGKTGDMSGNVPESVQKRT